LLDLIDQYAISTRAASILMPTCAGAPALVVGTGLMAATSNFGLDGLLMPGDLQLGLRSVID
jgi:hypothetical protein